MTITNDFTALAIIRNAAHVLIVERIDWPKNKNWSFPGGKQEGDELPNMTAYRELFEETGLSIDANRFSLLGQRVHPISQKTLVYLGARVQGECSDVFNKEPEKHRYVGFQQIDTTIDRMGRDNIFPPVLKFLSIF